MRRLVSIALMVVLGLPLFASVWGRTAEARLPVCCRRAGAHHCMEMGGAATARAGSAQTRSVLRMTCPAFPRGLAAVQTGVWTFAAVRDSAAEALTRPEVVGQVEAGYRVSQGRAWQKRGPPQTQKS